MAQQMVQKTSQTAQTQNVQKPATTQTVATTKPAGTQQPQMIAPPKKSIFKRWWFWLIAGLGILIIIFCFWYFLLR